MARPARFERATFRFVAECSIQLSHGRAVEGLFMSKAFIRQALFKKKLKFCFKNLIDAGQKFASFAHNTYEFCGFLVDKVF